MIMLQKRLGFLNVFLPSLLMERSSKQGSQTSGNSVQVLGKPPWFRVGRRGKEKSGQSGKIRHIVVIPKFTGKDSIC